MTNINEEEKVQVTISIPSKDIALLAPINYEELSEKVYQQFDLSSMATDVVEEIDDDELCDKVIGNLSYEELARELRDHVDLNDYIDTDDIASDAADRVDISDKIYGLLNDYSPEKNGCETNVAAYKAIIDTIRYDLMCYYYEKEDRTDNGVGTTTDLLRKIILKEMAKAGYPEKVVVENDLKNISTSITFTGNLKSSYTLDEIYNTISKMPSMNSEQISLVNAILKALPKE